MPADPQFDSWSASESQVSIDYSLVVLEEIRQEVNQGLQKFSRGGVDVGGVLYGTRDGRKIRITAIRMIDCGHAHGPSFILSGVDQMALASQLTEDAADPNLQGLICLGWFLSHNRGEMALTESDVTAFSQFFRDPWQVTLVIRPGRAGSMKAAFFVWEPDGGVRADQSYREFSLPDRLAAVPLPPRERSAEVRGAFRNLPQVGSPTRVEPRSSGPLMTAFDASQYMPMPAEAPTSKLPWIAGGAIAIIALMAFAFWQFLASPAAPPALGLVALERDGQLQVQWNGLAAPVLNAASGVLNIIDGGVTKEIPLAAPALASGKFIYVRTSGDVEVRLAVADADGKRIEEATRFLGRPPAEPAPVASEEDSRKLKKALEEIDRLKRDNAKQADRIAELERIRLILQNRLEIK